MRSRASFEEALSSLHSAAEEEKAVDCGLSCTSTDTGLTPDSAVGEKCSQSWKLFEIHWISEKEN